MSESSWTPHFSLYWWWRKQNIVWLQNCSGRNIARYGVVYRAFEIRRSHYFVFAVKIVVTPSTKRKTNDAIENERWVVQAYSRYTGYTGLQYVMTELMILSSKFVGHYFEFAHELYVPKYVPSRHGSSPIRRYWIILLFAKQRKTPQTAPSREQQAKQKNWKKHSKFQIVTVLFPLWILLSGFWIFPHDRFDGCRVWGMQNFV